jgi:hypothetical protein
MVIEHLPHQPKVDYLSAATDADTGRDKIDEKNATTEANE